MALTFDYKVRDRSGSLVEGQLDETALGRPERQHLARAVLGVVAS